MNKIKNIRQSLVEIRNIVMKGGNMTEDHYMTLEALIAHEHYGIRRQASGLMILISKSYRYQVFTEKLNPLTVAGS